MFQMLRKFMDYLRLKHIYWQKIPKWEALFYIFAWLTVIVLTAYLLNRTNEDMLKMRALTDICTLYLF